MHKTAMEMGKWAMEKAKTHGFDNLSAQDWDDLKDCMEAVKCAVCADKDYRIVEAMDECEQEEKYLGRMGYDRYRYSNGRFAPKGRGTRKETIRFQDIRNLQFHGLLFVQIVCAEDHIKRNDKRIRDCRDQIGIYIFILKINRDPASKSIQHRAEHSKQRTSCCHGIGCQCNVASACHHPGCKTVYIAHGQIHAT